jgi:hypothetical protein
MGSRRLAVGVLATVAVGLAAGAVAAGRPATGGVVVGLGGSGAAGRALAGVLWLLVVAVVIAGGAGVLLERLRRLDGQGRTIRPRLVVLAVAFVLAVLGAVLVAVRVFEDGSGPRRQDGVGGPLLQGSPDAAATPAGPGAGVVLGVLLAVALAAVVLGALRLRRTVDVTASGDRSAESDDEASEADADDGRDDLGGAAVRAADHLAGGGAPAENDVIRAYRELEAVVPVSRSATATPGEFAAAATDAGVDPDAVTELTALFETVRYGDREPTAAMAERAVAALERIESDDAADSSRDRGPDRTGEPKRDRPSDGVRDP